MKPTRLVLLAAAALSGAAASAFAAPDGAKIYEGTCIVCHGPEGRGALPGVPDFTAQKKRLANSEATLLKRVRNGYQSPGSPMAMPPKGGNSTLTDDDLKAVIKYMRRTFGR
jgi:cytochrome c5